MITRCDQCREPMRRELDSCGDPIPFCSAECFRRWLACSGVEMVEAMRDQGLIDAETADEALEAIALEAGE